jgi:hypothetical protein
LAFSGSGERAELSVAQRDLLGEPSGDDVGKHVLTEPLSNVEELAQLCPVSSGVAGSSMRSRTAFRKIPRIDEDVAVDDCYLCTRAQRGR